MDIKPCPACGGYPEIGGSADGTEVWIACGNLRKCRMGGPTRSTVEEAVEAWNALPRHKDVERLQKKIEELKETAERDDIDSQIVLGEAEKLAKALADNKICAYNVDDDGIAGAQEECTRLNDCRECWRAYAHEQVMAEIESEGE